MPVVNTYIPDSQLYHDLKQMGRNNFSYEGAKALMEYLDQLSEDMGKNIEYDPIGFCCEYSEYSNYSEIYEAYSNVFEDLEECEAELNEHTTVIDFNGGVIIQDF